MSEIAVIGGAGFIGARLVQAVDGARSIDRSAPPGEEAVRVDVRDRDGLGRALAGTDTVFLLAAEHADDVEPRSRYYEVNVGGAESVVSVARELGVRRIVFTSTVAVYGLNAPDATEDAVPDPFNDYARSKAQAEEILVRWAEEDASRSLVIVRPCVIFGEGNRGNVFNLLHQLARGRFRMVGSGRNRKSMAYVGNLVEFLKELAHAPPGVRILNYADKPDLSMSELVRIASDELDLPPPRLSIPYPVGLAAGHLFDIVARVTGRRLPVSSVRVRKFCAETTVNTDRVSAAGFEPPCSLEEGLRRTIRAEFTRKRPADSAAPATRG